MPEVESISDAKAAVRAALDPEAKADPLTDRPTAAEPPSSEPVEGAGVDLADFELAATSSHLRLTKLTLNGFKSFADKTEFTFEDPITGVVGPNGCGKSNLVDAIKWVLGERSSKSLRGKEMIDVIFAGSAARKPSGMAGVTLTFLNPRLDDAPAAEVGETSDDGAVEAAGDASGEGDAGEIQLVDRRRVRRPLPVDADEVAVERQLFRDGTSKYLINGRRARLKDIRDLFLDTGIGADAYSIIEQGKVDAMLLASPQERRTIFEEAAGVAKYKLRRIEAQRKLERTETNLVRTREQLENAERRLRMVRGQAAKARRFKELDDEYAALRMAVAFDQYDDVRQRLEGLTSRLSKLEVERDEAVRAVEALEAEKIEADAGRAEASDALRKTEHALRSAEHEGEAAKQRAEMSTRSIGEAQAQVENEQRRLDECRERLTALESDLSDAREASAALAESLAEAERELEGANARRAEVAERSAKRRAALSDARARASGVERQIRQNETESSGARHRLETLGEQLQKLEGRAAGLREDLGVARAALGEREADLQRHAGRVESLKGSISERTSATDALSDSRGRLASRVGELERDHARLDSRRQALDEMTRERAGLGEAAREAMRRRDAGEGFGAIIAPLAELIETESEHAAAVEAALGDDLGALLVRSAADLPSREELEGLPGRVRLVPLTGAVADDAAALPEGLMASLAARVTRVRSLVRARADLDQPTLAQVNLLLDRLLGSTLLVESLDAALMLSSGPMRGARFACRDGSVLERNGAVLAGPAGAESGAGMISRAAELHELTVELERVAADLDLQRGELERTDTQLAEQQRIRGELERELAETERAVTAAESGRDRHASEVERCERQLGALEAEAAEHVERRGELESRIAELGETRESLERLLEEQTAAAAEIERDLGALEAAANEAAESQSNHRAAVSRVSEQISGARREVRRLEHEAEQAERAAAEHARQVGEAADRKASYEETARLAAEVSEKAAGESERLKGEVETRRAAVTEMSALVEGISERLNGTREAARRVERDWHGVESARRELEVRRETLEERTSEDLPVDLANEYLDYRAVMSGGDVTPVDVPDAQARINVLRSEIKKLGNVNIDSIEEEGRLDEQNHELTAQVEDLDSAAMQLKDLIERLNVASKDRFGEVFERIRSNFGGQDGMFRKLFGGGRAEVRLMGLVKEIDGEKVQTDEVDLLESGIEVIAKPPGKEPRSISQLSGGEKTLTAVALLMSIFRSKPSCFCVLDEVDAALDESNVGRFCSVVREFTDKSRFIVITHNKRTMRMADHLYGVTQRERGVSSRVSVKFDQVGSDGTIAKDAAAAPVKDASGPPNSEGKPRGSLRKALAGMRPEGAVGVEADSAAAEAIESGTET